MGIVPAVHLLDGQGNCPVFRREFEGVGEQVVQHLLNPEGVAQQGRPLRLELLPQGLLLPLRLHAERGKAVLHARF